MPESRHSEIVHSLRKLEGGFLVLATKSREASERISQMLGLVENSAEESRELIKQYAGKEVPLMFSELHRYLTWLESFSRMEDLPKETEEAATQQVETDPDLSTAETPHEIQNLIEPKLELDLH